MRRFALVLSLLSVSSVALAQDGPIPVRSRVGDAVKTWTQDEILREFGPITRTGGGFGGRVVRQLPKVGRYIKWGGGLIVGGILVNDALNWFYNEAKRSTGTALDDWYKGGTVDFPPQPEYLYTGFGRMYYVGPLRTCYNAGKPYKVLGWYSSDAVYGYGAYYFNEGVWKLGEYYNRAWGYNEQSQKDNEFASCEPASAPPLSTVVNPTTTPKIKDIVTEYLDNNPKRVPPLLDPVPNANELEDDVVDPGLDTDGDGWTDGDEVRRGPNVTTTPGNRPHVDDGPLTDPSDPSSKPRDTDGDGVPDWRDSDDDNDGVPDDEETPDQQKDKDKKPDKYTDTDGDGLTDDVDPDDDGDGYPDIVEERSGSDPKNRTSTPPDMDGDKIPDSEDPDRDGDGVPNDEEIAKGSDPDDPESKPKEEEPIKCQAGQVPSEDGKSCVPEEDAPKCPEGTKLNDETKKCEPDNESKEPVGDECGDFSIPRLLAHTGHYLRDVVFPCEKMDELWRPIHDRLSGKFPFSVATALTGGRSLLQATGGGGSSPALPGELGPFKPDYGWANPLFLAFRALFRLFLAVVFVYWLLGKLAGQVVVQ